MPDTPESSPNPSGCGVCSAPTGDNEYLCRTHTFKLEADLRELPNLWTDLDVTRTRMDKLTLSSGSPSGAERPLYWNENAAAVAGDLQITVNAWALDVAHIAEDERDRLADIPQHNVPDLARWLVRNMHTLRRNPDAGMAHDELTDAIHQGWRIIDRPETKTRFEVGPCPEALPDGECGGKVWAFIPTNEDKVSYMRCLDCGADWDTTQWLRVGRRILTRIQQLKSA